VDQFHCETGMEIHKLQTLDNQGLLAQIPRNEEGEISSLGSAKHDLESACHVYSGSRSNVRKDCCVTTATFVTRDKRISVFDLPKNPDANAHE